MSRDECRALWGEPEQAESKAIMQCSGQRILCIGSATWQNMESLDTVHVGKEKHKWLNSQLTYRDQQEIPLRNTQTYSHEYIASSPALQKWIVNTVNNHETDWKIDMLSWKFLNTDCTRGHSASYSTFNLSADWIITSNLPSPVCQGWEVTCTLLLLLDSRTMVQAVAAVYKNHLCSIS